MCRPRPEVVVNRAGPSTPNTSAPATGLPSGPTTVPLTARFARVELDVANSCTSPASPVSCFPSASEYPAAVT